MFKVEYLSDGHWKVAIEIASFSIAYAEAKRLAYCHIVRMNDAKGNYIFPTRD